MLSTLYWIFEFIKVSLCYLFVMFIWPSVVFRKYLKNKSKVFRFCFCSTTQIVIINTAVLMLGLGYLLSSWTVNILFYGSLLLSIRKSLIPTPSLKRNLSKLVTGTLSWRGFILMYWSYFTSWLRKLFQKAWRNLRPHLIEYTVLAAIVIYGVIYFSYSSIFNHSYGFGDMYTHHSWIYGLTQQKIFSAGVYPEGMHCVVYLMHTISGLPVFNCNLFLGCIHVGVYLLAAYCLMREIFRWRGTPLLVLTVFLVVAVNGFDMVISMARLQRTLPGEYGLHTIFICALFLLRFLKEDIQKEWRNQPREWLKNDNLLVFYMALAASIAIHFYVTIIAFFVCLPFAIVFIRRALSRTRFLPLVSAVICGVVIAVAPMGGALLTGIPFQGSIGWAMEIISGEITESSTGDLDQFEDETPGYDSPDFDTPGTTDQAGDDTSAETTESLSAAGLWKLIKQKASYLHWFGYCNLIGRTNGTWMVYISLLLAAFCIVFRFICMLFRPLREAAGTFDNYLPAIGASLFILILYTAPYLKIPELISYNRTPSTAYILLLFVAAMPVDILFSTLKRFCANWMSQAATAVCVAVIFVTTVATGNYHGYFYNEFTRYRSVVDVTNSIIQSFPKNTYTIVATTDELYSVIHYGRHEELLDFLKKAGREPGYYLPTEYVFIYVEKKPLVHAQYLYSSGPAWLATDVYADNYVLDGTTSKYPDIKASEISDEDAKFDVNIYPTSYNSYRNNYIRTIVNSKANKWCRDFSNLYDHEMKVYYEGDDFICYYFRQNTYSLYDLAIWS